MLNSYVEIPFLVFAVYVAVVGMQHSKPIVAAVIRALMEAIRTHRRYSLRSILLAVAVISAFFAIAASIASRLTIADFLFVLIEILAIVVCIFITILVVRRSWNFLSSFMLGASAAQHTIIWRMRPRTLQLCFALTVATCAFAIIVVKKPNLAFYLCRASLKLDIAIVLMVWAVFGKGNVAGRSLAIVGAFWQIFAEQLHPVFADNYILISTATRNVVCLSTLCALKKIGCQMWEEKEASQRCPHVNYDEHTTSPSARRAHRCGISGCDQLRHSRSAEHVDHAGRHDHGQGF